MSKGELVEIPDELFAEALMEELYFKEMVADFRAYLRDVRKVKDPRIYCVFGYYLAQFSQEEMETALNAGRDKIRYLRKKVREYFKAYMRQREQERSDGERPPAPNTRNPDTSWFGSLKKYTEGKSHEMERIRRSIGKGIGEALG